MGNKLKKVIIISLVLIVGFFAGYFFKQFSFNEKDKYEKLILEKETEIEKLNEDYQALKKDNNDLKDLNDELEKELDKKLDELNELELKNIKLRKIIGFDDISGDGVEIIIKPVESLGTDDELTHKELIYLVNELKFAGAEAISINDKRITVQTGIQSSSNNEYILINDEKISPKDDINMKIIGDKDNLIAALQFSGTLEYESLENYNVKLTPKENLIIIGIENYIKSDNIR